MQDRQDKFDEDFNEKEQRRERHARKFRNKPQRRSAGRTSKADVRYVEEKIIREEVDKEIREAITGDV